MQALALYKARNKNKKLLWRKNTYCSTVSQAEVLDDVEGTCRRNKLAERWASWETLLGKEKTTGRLWVATGCVVGGAARQRLNAGTCLLWGNGAREAGILLACMMIDGSDDAASRGRAGGRRVWGRQLHIFNVMADGSIPGDGGTAREWEIRLHVVHVEG